MPAPIEPEVYVPVVFAPKYHPPLNSELMVQVLVLLPFSAYTPPIVPVLSVTQKPGAPSSAPVPTTGSAVAVAVAVMKPPNAVELLTPLEISTPWPPSTLIVPL